MDGIMHKWANPHFVDFEIFVFSKALTTSFVCQKSHMSRPITFCGTSQSLFAHAAFWQFSESTNVLTLTSDQIKKSEMDMSKNLKRKTVHC